MDLLNATRAGILLDADALGVDELAAVAAVRVHLDGPRMF